MLSRSVPVWCKAALTALGALLVACTAAPPRSAALNYTARLELPVELTAAICAGAVREALPFADPLPLARGAPVCRLAADHYEITFEQHACGAWTPNATHRLTIVGSGGHAGHPRHPGVRVQELTGVWRLPPLGTAPLARLHLRVYGSPTGAFVSGTLPAALADTLQQALDRAVRLAADPSAAVLGLTEPNLAALTAHRLLHEANKAQQAGQPSVAQALLHQVERLGHDDPHVLARLGELAAQVGDHDLAREQLWQALLDTDDPTARQRLASHLLSAEAAGLARAPGRHAARERLAVHDPAGAEAVLHTARRRWPMPAEDYRLQSRVHRQRHDDMAMLACSLLAREHEVANVERFNWPGALLPVTLPATLRRLASSFRTRLEPAMAAAVTEAPLHWRPQPRLADVADEADVAAEPRHGRCARTTTSRTATSCSG